MQRFWHAGMLHGPGGVEQVEVACRTGRGTEYLEPRQCRFPVFRCHDEPPTSVVCLERRRDNDFAEMAGAGEVLEGVVDPVKPEDPIHEGMNSMPL